MNSEQTARSGVARRQTRRWLRERSPWIAWLVSLVVIVWLGLSVSGGGMAPAVAEVRQVALASPRTARVAAVSVVPGDAVTAEQVLVQMDTSEIDAELAVARAELERLRLEIAAQGISLKEDALETVERLSSEAESTSLALAQIEAAEQRDRSELTQLDEQIGRQQRLVDEKLAAADALNELKLRRSALARTVEEYQRTVGQARARSQAAAQRLAEWRAGKRVGPAAQDSSLEQRLAPYRAAVDSQQERIRQIERTRTRLTLTAPFAGRVGEILLRAGDTAPANATVLTVVDNDPRNAIAYVEQMSAHRVQVGDIALLRPSDGSGPRRSGHVTAVAASISETPMRFRLVPSYPSYCRAVYIALDLLDVPPLPGQAFDVSFRRNRNPGRAASTGATADQGSP